MAPKILPRSFLTASWRHFRELLGPGCAQEAPKDPPRASKTSKIMKNTSNMEPTWSQNGFKMVQKCSQRAPEMLPHLFKTSFQHEQHAKQKPKQQAQIEPTKQSKKRSARRARKRINHLGVVCSAATKVSTSNVLGFNPGFEFIVMGALKAHASFR